jgi:hypothetical protein
MEFLKAIQRLIDDEPMGTAEREALILQLEFFSTLGDLADDLAEAQAKFRPDRLPSATRLVVALSGMPRLLRCDRGSPDPRARVSAGDLARIAK